MEKHGDLAGIGPMEPSLLQSGRGVAPEYQDACVEMCNRFIEMQAFGEMVPEGQPIRMRGLPTGIVCHHQGDYDDPDFNNVHIEIRMPE